MRRDGRAFLHDAIRAAEAVSEFAAGRTLEELDTNLMLSSALERQFEILGEALDRFSDLDPERAAQIGNLRRAVGMRNRIAHGYFSVDEETLLETAQKHIPPLLGELRAVMTSYD